MRREVIIGGFVECNSNENAVNWVSIKHIRSFGISNVELGFSGEMVYNISIDIGLSEEETDGANVYNCYSIDYDFTSEREAECGMRCILQHGCIDTDIIQGMLIASP